MIYGSVDKVAKEIREWGGGRLHMGQQLQDGKNLQYSSFYFFKGEAGVGCEMKVSKFGQVSPFLNGWETSIIEEKISNKYFHRFF